MIELHVRYMRNHYSFVLISLVDIIKEHAT